MIFNNAVDEGVAGSESRVEWAIFGKVSSYPLTDRRFASKEEAEAYINQRYNRPEEITAMHRVVGEWQ